jgi:hypothetical protein
LLDRRGRHAQCREPTERGSECEEVVVGQEPPHGADPEEREAAPQERYGEPAARLAFEATEESETKPREREAQPQGKA